MSDKIKFKGIPLENYSTYYNIDKTNSVRCYSKKQIKALYPKGNFKIVGEYPPKNESVADVQINNITLPIGEYGKRNQFVYSPRGYIECEGEKNSYVVLHKNSLLRKLIISIMLTAVILIGIYIFNNFNIGDVTNNSIIDLDPNAVDNDPNAKVNTSSSGIQIPGFKVINVKANSKDAQVSFSNPSGNPCYFVVSLLLDDGTELYKSKMIAPGKGIYNITMKKSLLKGEYNGLLKYETFGIDGLKPMNGADVKLTVLAK